ncbi:hypothetical protein [Microbispora sp. NBRC 16548]|uniref:hypothetical protein n=1 Tax=Microbispora sp. NBRC 16548 TaxID=3030994 RepID=UPI0024A5487D|nr:hypothetical protein [Microbispora sp. NBRC 16548]GLX07467.1 hypothetical protein Misp03_43930 [Microbispora sp. NBRC 16548]
MRGSGHLRELCEAAAIDGASPWRVAWAIKVPMVRPPLILTGVFSIIGTVQLFNPSLRSSLPPAPLPHSRFVDGARL